MAASPPERRPDLAPRRSPLAARGRRRHRSAWGLTCVLAALLAAHPLGAQQPGQARLQGRVVRGDSAALPSVTVVLHRVTPESSGEIDSLSAGPAGEFAFALPSVPDPLGNEHVYFAAVNHQGVMYFGAPLHQASQLDSTYVVQVHDTTMVPAGGAALPLILRYLILEAAEDGWFLTDVIQLENAGETTLVAPEGEPVWRYPLPPGASELEVGQLDISAEAIALKEGSLEVSAPITPGVRQFMVRYRLAGPRLDLPLPGPVRQVELLVREPAPVLTVRGLMLNDPAEMEPGVTYRRYSAVEVADVAVTVVPGTERRVIPHAWLAIVMGMMLAAVTVWAVQRGGPMAGNEEAPVSPWLTLRERQEQLLLGVAHVDERLEGEGAGDEDRVELRARREALLRELRSLG